MIETKLKLHVTPRSSRNQIIGWRDDALCIKVMAPPVEGSANKAICEFVAKSLGLKKNQVSLESGEKSRDKTIIVCGMSFDDIKSALCC